MYLIAESTQNILIFNTVVNNFALNTLYIIDTSEN